MSGSEEWREEFGDVCDAWAGLRQGPHPEEWVASRLAAVTARAEAAERKVAAALTLADHLCDYDSGRGDYPQAGRLVRAAIAADHTPTRWESA